MTDTKISGLPAAASANDTMELPVNDSGTTKKVTRAQLVSSAAIAAALNGTATGLLWAGGGPSNIFPDVNGNPSSTQLENLIRGTGTNVNACTHQSISADGFAATSFADNTGHFKGAIGYGNPSSTQPFTSSMYLEGCTPSGQPPEIRFVQTLIGTGSSIRWKVTTGNYPAGGHLVPGTNDTYSIGDYTNGVASLLAPSHITAAQTIGTFQRSGLSIPNDGTGWVMGYDATSLFLYAGNFPAASSSRRQFGMDISNLYVHDGGNSNLGQVQVGGSASGNVGAPMLVNSSAIMQVKLADNSAFTFLQAQLRTSVNATTGLSAGALSATTNASIVIYDGSGQAYRVPCII